MTEKWGPDFWAFFHHVSINYPTNPTETDKYKICCFIKSIPHILPCEICSSHFKQNFEKLPIDDTDISSRNKFVTWFVDFHNIVNKMLKKRIFSKFNAQVYIDSLQNTNYMVYFKKVLDHIDNKIKNNISSYKCKEILNFIDASLYFSNKKFANINISNTKITNKEDLQKLKKNIFLYDSFC